MNDEQSGRLNKLLRVTGYIISGAIVWFYVTKWIVSFLPPSTDIVIVYFAIGILWVILAGLIIQTCYYLYTWVSTGKGKNFLDLISDREDI